MGPAEGLRSELHRLFREANAEGTLYRRELAVIDTLTRDSAVTNRLTGAGIDRPEGEIRFMVGVSWHSHFQSALRQGELDPPSVRILCGIGEVRDRTLAAQGIQKLVDWAERNGLNHQEAEKASKRQDVERKVSDINEAIGVLIRWYDAQGKSGHKTNVEAAELFDALDCAYEDAAKQGAGYGYSTLGGVPAIMADVLAQLGVRDVALFAPYHSENLAALYQGRPKWLVLSKEGERLDEISAGDPKHPERCSFIAAYKTGDSFRMGKNEYKAKDTDRAIFRVGAHIGTELSEVTVKFPDGSEEGFTPSENAKNEWPFYNFFYRWEFDGNRLSVIPLGEHKAEDVGRMFDYVLLRAADFGRLTNPDWETEILLKQLDRFAAAGARVHFELSGVAPVERIDLQAVRKRIAGIVRSVGMNDKELMKLAGARGVSGGADPVLQTYLLDRPTGIIGRCHAAVHVATALGLERLYVHADDIDLVIRKAASPTVLRAELYADLLAKWTVVLAAVQRRYPDKYQDVLSNALSNAQGRASSHPLIPYLSDVGFKCLIELFTDLVKVVPALRGVSGREVKGMLNSGYWWNRAGGYSLVAVPVMWPQEELQQIEVNTTGAGDTSSAISAVYAGF